MRIAVIASLLLASVALSANAFADTITFASVAGVTTFSAPAEGNGIAAGYQNSAYAQPLAGSNWVSTTNTGVSGVETLLYTSSFTLLDNELYSGTASFMADNLAGVMVNGVEIYPLNPNTGFTSPTSIDLLSNYFHAGVNTFTLEARNTDGPGAGDFAGTLTGVSTAVTPEPSSLILLGTGLLAFAATQRRFRIS